MEKSNAQDDRLHKKKWLPQVSLKFLLAVLLFFLAAVSFAFIAHQVVLQKDDIFDKEVAGFFDDYDSAEIVSAMTFLTDFGSSRFLLPAYFLLVTYCLFTQRKNTAVNIIVVALTSTGMLHLLKRLFQRQRPGTPMIESLKTFSFPSGHALSAIVFSMVLVALLWKARVNNVVKWIGAVLLFCFALAVGVSRIVLKMHYPSDVIAGFCLGIVWVLVCFYLFGIMEQKRKRNAL